MPFIAARKRVLVKEFADYRIEGIERFPLYFGPAHFLSPTELAVGDGTVLEAKKFVIATGSRISAPDLPGLSETGYLDSDGVLELETIPKSVIVLGRRIYRLRTRAVSRAHGRADDDPHSQRSSADPE